MNQALAYKLQTYYNNPKIRVLINTIYILCEIVLSLYLLFIPIQIAYYWLLISSSQRYLQDVLDGIAVTFFLIHIGLYMDEKVFEWMKSPYTKLWRKIVTVEFVYDVMCLILAVYAMVVPNQSIIERIVELVFFFKIYKLVKFDIKCMYIVIGTWFYSFYKIFRTLLIMFMAISYVGSLFYGIAYYLYKIPIENTFLLWIVETGAITDCVDQPFIIQLEYAMYWALGTASTAAYGDISAAQPVLVFINILALAFEGFLFGFYLNSMHSIPIQRKQKQANLLQKFDAFQHHCSNRKIDKKLYLQILCSLQYTQSKKKSMQEIEKLLPHRYLQQIKSNIYNSFICDPLLFGEQEFQMEISSKIEEHVCEMDEDVYHYKFLGKDDLFFVKEGVVRSCLYGEFGYISESVIKKGYYIGLYQFITGLLIPHTALCLNYCFLYRIKRSDYKQILPEYLKYQLNSLQTKAFQYISEDNYLQRQPIIKFIKSLQKQNVDYAFFNYWKKIQIIERRYKLGRVREKVGRLEIGVSGSRSKSKSRKIIDLRKKKNKDAETQTQNFRKLDVQVVYHWKQSINRSRSCEYGGKNKINLSTNMDQIQLKQLNYL